MSRCLGSIRISTHSGGGTRSDQDRGPKEGVREERLLMGGRGASSGTSANGNKYGSKYHSVMTVGNIKFVEKNSKSPETLMETMTSGRVYAIIDRGEPKSIVYFDTDNKRNKQIDLESHNGLSPHVHHGYLHDEYSPNGCPTRLSVEQSRMADRVLSQWQEYKRRK